MRRAFGAISSRCLARSRKVCLASCMRKNCGRMFNPAAAGFTGFNANNVSRWCARLLLAETSFDLDIDAFTVGFGLALEFELQAAGIFRGRGGGIAAIYD